MNHPPHVTPPTPILPQNDNVSEIYDMPSDTNNIHNNTNLNLASPYHIPRFLIGDDDNIQSLIKIARSLENKNNLRFFTGGSLISHDRTKPQTTSMGFGWTEPSPPITYNGSTTFNYRLVGQKVTDNLPL
jgi:hypothetical protein